MGPSNIPDPSAATGLTRTRVAVLSDQRLVAELVALALQERGIDVAVFAWPGTDRQTRETSRRVLRFDPAVALAACDVDDVTAAGAVTQVLVGIPTPWVLLTGTPPGPTWGAALRAGAREVLPTSTALDDVVDALHRTVLGLEVMPPEQRAAVLEQWGRVEDDDQRLLAQMRLLTTRESVVLGQLFEGSSVREIAERAGLSEATVRSQVKSVLRKLEVGSQLAAVAAFRRVRETGGGQLPTR